MEFVHRCAFCGYSRSAQSPTIVEPHCERCGCLLVSESEREASRALVPPEWIETAARRHTRLGRGLMLAAAFAVMFAAAVGGYAAAGVWPATAAFAAAGFLMLPFLAPDA